MGHRGCTVCTVCERANVRICYCPTCCKQSVADKRRVLKKIEQRRNELRALINDKLEAQADKERQRHSIVERTANVLALSSRKAALEAELCATEEDLTSRQVQVSAKSEELVQANALLKKKRQEKLENEYPDTIRVHSLQYRVLAEQLAQQQRQKMRKLRFMLPLRLGPVPRASDEGRRSRPTDVKQPPYISICGIKLPTNDDCSGMSAKELAAALGYLLHFVNLASKYLGSPVLHESAFMGSASTIWQAQSFWPGPPPEGSALP
eukprot:CAMPEP_0118952566 /NCGR_PEP_ID=MMETSP1169-20130426/55089_1 /TAXON_ID=36882 /ORGANISM="Pyramimonas obovata, Strain CCMP722" /LENGTH=264 /DNA_ID=CAMNT_0006899853 /DNA_START=163 /DNA_END=953 /DNA_ORIENTATION=+